MFSCFCFFCLRFFSFFLFFPSTKKIKILFSKKKSKNKLFFKKKNQKITKNRKMKKKKRGLHGVLPEADQKKKNQEMLHAQSDTALKPFQQTMCSDIRNSGSSQRGARTVEAEQAFRITIGTNILAEFERRNSSETRIVNTRTPGRMRDMMDRIIVRPCFCFPRRCQRSPCLWTITRRVCLMACPES